MAFAIPAAVNDHDVSPLSNAEYSHQVNSPTSEGTKANGSLPLSDTAGDWERDDAQTRSGNGFTFPTAQDVSTDTVVMLWGIQSNAPNRIQMDSLANNGYELRIFSGSGAPPSNYHSFVMGGNDSPMSASVSGQFPLVLDLNAAGYDSSGGTFDNTDITVYESTFEPFAEAGGSTGWKYEQKMHLVDTTKSSSDTPTFSGTSDFDDAVTEVQGSDYTDKQGNWVRQIGSVYFIDLPFRIGNNSTETDFNDNGVTVISPVDNDTADPSKRLTTQAMRTYLNLRNNAADSATFSGTWIWGTRAPFDWDQDDAAVVTFSSPTFKGMGTFTIGSSITGPATWDDVDTVVMADTSVDIDGSTFKNPNDDHCLELGGVMDIADMRFESYTGAHAILIDTAGTYEFDNVFFDGSGTNEVETTHASGTVTINIVNGGTVPGVTETGAGDVVVNNNKTVTVKAVDTAAANIQNARVLVEADTGGALPADDSVTITRSGSTATVTHTGHGLATSDAVSIVGADQGEYNGTQTITVTGANTYTYTVSGTPTTPATGTITSTYQVLNALTNASGEAETTTFNYTADQPIRGKIRKAGSDPRYKPATFTGTITTSGFNTTITMFGD